MKIYINEAIMELEPHDRGGASWFSDHGLPHRFSNGGLGFGAGFGVEPWTEVVDRGRSFSEEEKEEEEDEDWRHRLFWWWCSVLGGDSSGERWRKNELLFGTCGCWRSGNDGK